MAELNAVEQDNYSSHLYSQSVWKATSVQEIKPIYSETSPEVDGRVVVRDNFDKIFEKYPETLIFGEDTGNIGDVNQGLEGMQEKYGESRVADTGIREATILGQGIGMAMRGLRPIAEIQYLDYILYCLQGMSDDLATLQYRTKGGQKAPLIIRTRGHRLKETLPDNLGEFNVPVGKIETTKEGTDITLVTYGSTWRLVTEASKTLEKLGINAEIIDIQSLIPFDVECEIVESLKKTNRLAIIDEDVEGGASAYILQQILEKQNGYQFLDSQPLTITAKNHRPAYGTDGDYFSKPSIDDIVERIYGVFNEVNPQRFPL